MADLAIDTSSSYLSIAIVRDDITLYEKSIYSLKLHSILLPSEIERALEITKEKIERIFIGIGPGSFTGLRVGLSLVKGMAFGSNIPVIGVPSFDGLAYNIPPRDRLIIFMRYRMSMSYYGLYVSTDKRWVCEKIGVSEIEDPPKLVNGEMVAVVKEHNYREIADRFQDPILITPRASLLVIAGRDREPEDPEKIIPLYIEPSEAEKISSL